jgi:hypothetical protein
MFILLFQSLIHFFSKHQWRHRLSYPLLKLFVVPKLVFHKVLHLHLYRMLKVLMDLIQCHGYSCI